MSNPIADYIKKSGTGTTELARLLGVSKGYVSQLRHGDRPVTLRVARRLSALSGKPWYKILDEADS